MNAPLSYLLLADLVLTLHAAVIVFVVGGLVAIVAGGVRGWRWTKAGWFRAAHLAAIAIVAVQAWLGAVCPLTSLEMWLRAKGGTATYAGGFIEHWLHRLLFYQAPAWVFTLAYSAFGLAVAAAWWYFPPSFSRPDPEKNP